MSMLKRKRATVLRQQYFSTFVSNGEVTTHMVPNETCLPMITDNFGDWTDDMAVRLGSDVLRRCTGYPAERVLRRLYKT
ncbi:hypothetical protein V5799_005418 [Amblyomma americanum]|uniref:Uncharacterized protein n=1 Tax=Amblyomma americanum TaxID=6943 RepID=A0AAQ4DZB1_AMBAM